MAITSMLAIGKRLTAEQKIQNALTAILQHPRYTALAGVLMIGKRDVIEAEMPFTARTNGKDEQYGRQFVDAIDMRAVRMLVLHETYHKLFRHMITWQHLYREDAEVANIAADIVVNNLLFDENDDNFLAMPVVDGDQIGVHVPQCSGMDTAQVFNLLKQHKNNKDKSKGGGGGQQSANGKQLPDFDSMGDQPMDDHDWDGAQEMDAAARDELGRQIDQAVRQGALLAGTQGGKLNRTMEELLEPQVRWQDQLREFMNTIVQGRDYSSWRKPNRRWIGAGMYLPSGVSETIGGIVVAIDTSGSIGGPVLSAFLSEVKGICDTCKPDWVRVLYWDSEVAGDETYLREQLDELTKTTKPKGGGGTVVSVVPDYMRKHNIKPVAAVVLTDGYIGGGWGHWDCPTLWCIIGNPGTVAGCGKTIHIKE